MVCLILNPLLAHVATLEITGDTIMVQIGSKAQGERLQQKQERDLQVEARLFLAFKQ